MVTCILFLIAVKNLLGKGRKKQDSGFYAQKYPKINYLRSGNGSSGIRKRTYYI
jgi:hypothetical protein